MSTKKPAGGSVAAEPLYERIRRVRTIGGGRGLRALLYDASRVVENPLALINSDGELLAVAEHGGADDPILSDLRENGSLSSGTQQVFRDEGFIDEIANARTIALLVSDKLRHDRLFGMIKSRDGIPVAGLMMVMSDRPFEYGDPVVFEAVCGLLEREIREMQELTDYGRQCQQSLIVTLLESCEIDRGMYSAHIAGLYMGLDLGLYVAVAQPPERTGGAALTELREQLRRLAPVCKFAAHDGRVVILTGSDRPPPRILRFLEQKNITVGVSGRFENAYELRRYYDEAVRAIGSLRQEGAFS